MRAAPAKHGPTSRVGGRWLPQSPPPWRNSAAAHVHALARFHAAGPRAGAEPDARARGRAHLCLRRPRARCAPALRGRCGRGDAHIPPAPKGGGGSSSSSSKKKGAQAAVAVAAAAAAAAAAATTAQQLPRPHQRLELTNIGEHGRVWEVPKYHLSLSGNGRHTHEPISRIRLKNKRRPTFGGQRTNAGSESGVGERRTAPAVPLGARELERSPRASGRRWPCLRGARGTCCCSGTSGVCTRAGRSAKCRTPEAGRAPSAPWAATPWPTHASHTSRSASSRVSRAGTRRRRSPRSSTRPRPSRLFAQAPCARGSRHPPDAPGGRDQPPLAAAAAIRLSGRPCSVLLVRGGALCCEHCCVQAVGIARISSPGPHDGRSLAAGRAWIVCTDVCGRPDRSWLIFSRASRKGRASSSSFARCARAVGLMDERRAAFGRPDRVLSCGLWLAACKQRTKRKESADNQQWARGESHRQVHLLHTRKSKGCGCEDTRDGCCVR